MTSTNLKFKHILTLKKTSLNIVCQTQSVNFCNKIIKNSKVFPKNADIESVSQRQDGNYWKGLKYAYRKRNA